MAIIGHIEARGWRGKLKLAAIIAALTLGGLTMIYPFVVMVSGSLRSDMDSARFDVVPDYLVDDAELYRKFLETKYNQDARWLNATHLTGHTSFRDPTPPTVLGGGNLQPLREYLVSPDLPLHWQNLGGTMGVRSVPENLRTLRQRLDREFDGDLDAIGRALGAPLESWNHVRVTTPAWLTRRFDYQSNVLYDAYFDLLRSADAGERVPVSLTGLFLETMIFPRYGSSHTREYNAHHASLLGSYAEFRLSATPPGDPVLREEWLEFVASELNPSFVVVEGATQGEYAAWQAAAQTGPVQQLPDGRRWLSGEDRAVYQRFLEQLPPERLRLVGPEFEVQGLFQVLPALEYDYVLLHRVSLRWRYATRNYITVFDELLLQGGALVNTAIYCALAIVLALLINPLAAYALSRFKLPGTYKVLMLLMATMAFPPMVAMIPQFILLRKLDLLNTYAALVIPLIADGYMIFLLKGFFDSLPRELYESARIDGAGELRVFFQITLALSKPILAVLALGTFTAAYVAFLYPILVAPDPEMWTISVWLYQFQQRANSAAVYASVLVTSIPTLLVFLLAQRTIMRGIVVPTEK